MNTELYRIEAPVTHNGEMQAYLDINSSTCIVGGDDISCHEYEDLSDDEAEREYVYFRQIEHCGKQWLNGNRISVRRCKKVLCPFCGGKDKLLHNRRYKTILQKVGNLDDKIVRHLVFTIPEELRRPFFFVRVSLNSLFNIVNNILRRHFGVKTGEKVRKKGTEDIYRLDKGAVAVLHLFGKEGLSYNPHIHVLVIEQKAKRTRCKLSREKLEAIKESYERALRSLLLRPVPNAVFHYSYASTTDDIRRMMRYVATPFDPEMPCEKYRKGDVYIFDLLIQELHRFQYVRYFGEFANRRNGGRYSASEYRGHKTENVFNCKG